MPDPAADLDQPVTFEGPVMTGPPPGAAVHRTVGWGGPLDGVVAAAGAGSEPQGPGKAVGAVGKLNGHVTVLGGRADNVLSPLERARLRLAAVSGVLAVRGCEVLRPRRGLGLQGDER